MPDPRFETKDTKALGNFVAQCQLGDIPPEVITAAKYSVLDGVEPRFEVGPVEMVEADVFTFDVPVVYEVAQEAFQADPVGPDRLRRASSHRGHVGVEVVSGEAPEVRDIGIWVAFHSNPTSGSSNWLFWVM